MATGVRLVNRRLNPYKLATAGALALGLLLAACGLRGPLDPPPAETPPPQAQIEGQPQPQPPPPRGDTTVPMRQRVFLDWLLD
jgi:predicted small lipoprotein YifL